MIKKNPADVVNICIILIYWVPDNSGPRTTRTETSRPVSEDKSARKRGLVGPYVKTTRTVWKDYADHQ